MEVILKAGDSAKIPENCTVTERDGMVIFEPVKPKFKKGDFVIGNDKYLPFEAKIVEFVSDGMCHYDSGNCCSFEYLRYATDKEKQLLLDKLHENGKDWDAEKCEIVDLKYVPKVGDCLKIEWNEETVFIECMGLEDGKYPCGYETIIDCCGVYEHNFMPSGWGIQWKVTKITREELQAEFYKLGYEYDFNTHTAKKIEWKPKKGDEYYGFASSMNVHKYEWENLPLEENWYKNGAVFRTRKLAEAALELLKNAKHY